MTDGSCVIAKNAQGLRQLMMLRDEFLEGIVPHVTEFERPDGGAYPYTKRRVLVFRFGRLCRIVEFIDDDSADDLHGRLCTVDACIVLFYETFFQGLECLLQHKSA